MIVIAIEDGVFQGCWQDEQGGNDVVLLDMDAVHQGDHGVDVYDEPQDFSCLPVDYQIALNTSWKFLEANGGHKI